MVELLGIQSGPLDWIVVFAEARDVASVLHDPVRLVFEMDCASRYVPRGYE